MIGFCRSFLSRNIAHIVQGYSPTVFTTIEGCNLKIFKQILPPAEQQKKKKKERETESLMISC